MKNPLSWLLAGFLFLGSPACIYVRVTGDSMDEEFWGDDGFFGDWSDEEGSGGLNEALRECLDDPEVDLDVEANPWRTRAEWTVSFAGPSSDGHAAFHRAKEAVLERIRHEEGVLGEQRDEGPHAWSCSFRIDGEPGEAAVRLQEDRNPGSERPHELRVSWKAHN